MSAIMSPKNQGQANTKANSLIPKPIAKQHEQMFKAIDKTEPGDGFGNAFARIIGQTSPVRNTVRENAKQWFDQIHTLHTNETNDNLENSAEQGNNPIQKNLEKLYENGIKNEDKSSKQPVIISKLVNFSNETKNKTDIHQLVEPTFKFFEEILAVYKDNSNYSKLQNLLQKMIVTSTKLVSKYDFSDQDANSLYEDYISTVKEFSNIISGNKDNKPNLFTENITAYISCLGLFLSYDKRNDATTWAIRIHRIFPLILLGSLIAIMTIIGTFALPLLVPLLIKNIGASAGFSGLAAQLLPYALPMTIMTGIAKIIQPISAAGKRKLEEQINTESKRKLDRLGVESKSTIERPQTLDNNNVNSSTAKLFHGTLNELSGLLTLVITNHIGEVTTANVTTPILQLGNFNAASAGATSGSIAFAANLVPVYILAIALPIALSMSVQASEPQLALPHADSRNKFFDDLKRKIGDSFEFKYEKNSKDLKFIEYIKNPKDSYSHNDLLEDNKVLKTKLKDMLTNIDSNEKLTYSDKEFRKRHLNKLFKNINALIAGFEAEDRLKKSNGFNTGFVEDSGYRGFQRI